MRALRAGLSSAKPCRLFHLMLCGWLLAICGTGCSWDRSYFQFDSNYRMPFFGLEFSLPPTAQNDRTTDRQDLQSPATVNSQRKIRAQTPR